jgi:ribose-phosphate pyrophosphokinase
VKPVLFALPDNEALADVLSRDLEIERGEVVLRRFPDGETYVRFQEKVAGKEIILLCTLHAPDRKILPLYFLAETARELGAIRIGLIAPYLAYMRQDRRFQEGEGITSRYFSKLISNSFDWLITVDPHLHRYHSLNEIYSIPTKIVQIAPVVSHWIRKEVKDPLLIGPDSESEQWVSKVAQGAHAPYVILNKVRRGDRKVEVSIPNVELWRKHTPVLVDDIISTGHTMMETIHTLKKMNLPAPVCIGIHAVFSDRDFKALLQSGAVRVVTSNTIPHKSNALDISDLLAQAVRDLETSSS